MWEIEPQKNFLMCLFYLLYCTVGTVAVCVRNGTNWLPLAELSQEAMSVTVTAIYVTKEWNVLMTFFFNTFYINRGRMWVPS